VLRIGIAGFGTVGQGALAILREHAALLASRCGKQLEVVAVSMRDTKKKRDISLNGIRVESDALALAHAPDIDLVAELIGGHEGVAKQLVETAIANGKHVVTANKALIAHHGFALAKAAEEKGVVLAFEAAVAGGIPIIAGLRQGLAANRINRVAGILNGTCNYILTTMARDKRDYSDVFAEAQGLGYVEADPALDIDGIDAAHKVSILATLAFGTAPDFDHVVAEGIRRITLLDMETAESFGYAIKLLGIATFENGALSQRVSPCLVPLNSPLAAVNGGFNAVQVEGDAVGRVVFEGRGAGGGPTGSAVVSDIMAIARGDTFPPFIVPSTELKKPKTADAGNHKGRYYLRLSLKDEPGVLAEFTRAFAQADISVHSITQRAAIAGHSAQVIVITHETNAAAVATAAAAIAKLSVSVDAPVVLRIED
jgi:homoserine dehydrogenase